MFRPIPKKIASLYRKVSWMMMLTLSVGIAFPAQAKILFQDDNYGVFESPAIQIGSNHAGASNSLVKFGADAINSNNGNIIWDISSRQFDIDHPVHISNLTSGDSFRIDDNTNDTTPLLIDNNGNMAVGSDFFDPIDPEKLKVEANENQSNVISATGDLNDNLYMTVKNRNSGFLASSSFAAQADNNDVGVLYSTAMGITSSGFAHPYYTLAGPNESFLVSFGYGLDVGTGLPGMPIKFGTGGTMAENERMRIDGDGNVGIGTTTPTSKLDVKGDVHLSGSTSGYIGLKAPATAGNYTFTLPNSYGSSGNSLVTDGAGNLSWLDLSAKFQRIGNTLSPLTAGDNLTTSGDIYTTGSGAITSAGILSGSGGLNISGGAANLNVNGTANTNINSGSSTGTVNIGNSSSGAVTIKSGTGVYLGSSSGSNINIGSGAGTATPDLLKLDIKSTSGDPAGGTDGAMYYNNNSNKFRCYTNGSWGDCDTTGGTATLQSVYNAGSSITTGGNAISFNLADGGFSVNGAGSVNLTPTSASSFTSGAALTLTGGASSAWGTSSGNLRLYANGTSAGNVQIGTGSTNATADVLVLDQGSTAPTGTNGAMYYDTSLNSFRCYVNGGWQDCGATAASATTLQQAYNAGNTISTSGSNLTFTINSTNAFNVSGSGSVNLTPTGASSFTSGNGLTLRGGAASNLTTTAGALTLDAGTTTPAALNLGTTSANAINIGRTGISTTNSGSLTSSQTLTASNGFTLTTGALNLSGTSGALSISGLSSSSISTGSNAFTLTGSPININTTGTGTTNLGSVTANVNLPGLIASKPVFTDASKNLTSSGIVDIANGGTGQATKAGAFDALSPGQAKGDLIVFNGTTNTRLPVGGINNQTLVVDNTSATGLKWSSLGSGTVTSVDATAVGTGMTLSTGGSPITTSGTITLSGTLDLDNGGTGAITASGARTNLGVDGVLIGTQVFTSGSGTYTPSANTKAIMVEMVGGGGGGGGTTGQVNQFAAAGGGGGGAYTRVYINSVTGSYTYTVGAGGTGGSTGNGNGSSGGTTSFNSSAYTALGGSGGTSNSNNTGSISSGGAGGASGVTGNVNLAGQPGMYGYVQSSTLGASGNGGSSVLGGGAIGVVNVNATGNNGGNYGGGGSGALTNVSVNRAGGNGGGGVIIVWEYK